MGDYAKPRLEAMRGLAVGKAAPEIEGRDVDGNPMKLSDYRGKVVVLSFWGTWCGPCMRFIPDEKNSRNTSRIGPSRSWGSTAIPTARSSRRRSRKRGSPGDHGGDGRKPAGPSPRDGMSTRGRRSSSWTTPAVIRFRNLPHHVPRLLDEAVDSLLKEMKP